MAWPGLPTAAKDKVPTDDILTARDVARELKISVSWVNAALRRGDIPHLQMGPRTRRVLRSQLEAYKARMAS